MKLSRPKCAGITCDPSKLEVVHISVLVAYNATYVSTKAVSNTPHVVTIGTVSAHQSTSYDANF